MGKMQDKLREFFQGLSDDVVEERVIDYVTEEIKKGRRLQDILEEPYVRNRLNEERRKDLLEHPDIVEAVDKEVHDTFERLEGSI